MSDFFPGLEEFEAERRQQSGQRYDQRLLRRMLVRLTDESTAKEIEREAGEEFGFMWFTEAYSPPIQLSSWKSEIVIKPADMLAKALMKKPIGEAFIDAKAVGEEGVAVGVVFPVKGMSNWIIHDSDVHVIPGVTAVIRNGQDGSRLTMMPFDGFAESLRTKWQP